MSKPETLDSSDYAIFDVVMVLVAFVLLLSGIFHMDAAGGIWLSIPDGLPASVVGNKVLAVVHIIALLLLLCLRMGVAAIYNELKGR